MPAIRHWLFAYCQHLTLHTGEKDLSLEKKFLMQYIYAGGTCEHFNKVINTKITRGGR